MRNHSGTLKWLLTGGSCLIVTATAGLTGKIMDHPDLTVSNFMENSIGLKRAKAMALIRPPDKSAYWNIILFISHPKHMLWVLKRTISMRPKTHV